MQLEELYYFLYKIKRLLIVQNARVSEDHLKIREIKWLISGAKNSLQYEYGIKKETNEVEGSLVVVVKSLLIISSKSPFSFHVPLIFYRPSCPSCLSFIQWFH